ncbi:MAG: oxidoreductase, partial [Bacteroidetes bacterium]|nr:oxidoreductase [Bacteroidota bacterium]
MKSFHIFTGLILHALLTSCGSQAQNPETMFTPIEGKVKLMNVDPGHFHAALVQK